MKIPALLVTAALLPAACGQVSEQEAERQAKEAELRASALLVRQEAAKDSLALNPDTNEVEGLDGAKE